MYQKCKGWCGVIEAYTFSKLLFYGLLPLLLFVPLRFLIPIYIIMCNLDVFGLGNTIKIVVVPLIILFRMKNYYFLIKRGKVENNEIDLETYSAKNKIPSATIGKIVWIILIGFSFVSLAWSQANDFTAGLKYVINGAGLVLVYMLFKEANKLQLITSKTITLMIIFTLSLGMIQTFVVQSAFGVQYSRFTSFIASQPYAAFLVGLFALVLWNKNYNSIMKLILSGSLLVALLSNGSRTWFLGACAVFLVWFVVSSRKSLLSVSMFFLSSAFAIVAFLSFYSYAIDNEDKLRQASRLFDGFYTLVGHSPSSGTIDARSIMNDGMVFEIGRGSTEEKLFGHGTSSAANVADRYSFHYQDAIDKNRVAHNEWLRIIYEFGILGITLWVVFILSSLIYLIKYSMSLPLLSYALAVLISSFTENIVMSAGSVGLCGLLILTAIRTPKELKAKEEKLDFQMPAIYYKRLNNKAVNVETQ